MAIFLYNNRSIAYQMELAPFAPDLVLLQGSRFGPEYWRPVLEDLSLAEPAGGRILTCDWSAEAFKEAQGEDLIRLIQTLGLQSVHLVACDDAVDLVASVQKINPALFEKTLLFPVNPPRGEELKRAVRAFCPF